MKENINFMHMLKYALILIFAMGMMQSCEMATCGPSKKAFLTNFERLVQEIDQKDMSIADEDWKKYDERFRRYVEECYDHYEADMTAREKRKFWMQSLKYYATRYGEGMLNELANSDDRTTRKIERNIEETLEETGHNIEEFLEKNAEEIEVLLEEVGKDLEAWAQRLKEILEE